MEALKEYNNAKNLLLVGSGELDLSVAEEASSKHGHDGDTLQKVVEECVITMESTDYENNELLTTQVANIQEGGVSIMASPDRENEDNSQVVGWQGVNEGPLQVFMVECLEGIKEEMIVSEEGNPEEPGSYTITGGSWS